MSLHLCVECATIYDCEPHHEKVCPRCGQSLELREEFSNGAKPIWQIAAEAMSGPAPRLRPRWSVE